MFPYRDRFLPSFFPEVIVLGCLPNCCPSHFLSQIPVPTTHIPHSFPWRLLTKPFLIAKLVFLSTHRKLSLSKASTFSKFQCIFILFKYHRRICSSFQFISGDSDWKISCKNAVQRLHKVILGLKIFRTKSWRQNVQKWDFLVREKLVPLLEVLLLNQIFLPV